MRGRRRWAGFLILGCLWFASGSAWPVTAATPTSIDAQLDHADSIKSADNARFVTSLTEIDRLKAGMTAPQREKLAYLQGWQLAYQGNYQAGIPHLESLADHATDADVRFRANVTLVNMFEITHRYEQAYERMQSILDTLPKANRAAREQALGVASELYDTAGQTDLALDFANRLLAEASNAHVLCKAMHHRQQAYLHGQRDRAYLDGLQAAIDACSRADEPIYLNLIRVDAAQVYLRTGRTEEAVSLLMQYHAQAQETGYRELTSTYDAMLARAFFEKGDLPAARQYALASIAESIQGQVTTGLVNAYLVMYRFAKSSGDTGQALDYYEKYVAAVMADDSDARTRALAYQMVHQQVLDKKAQIAALSQQNQLLELRQSVQSEKMLATKLAIALLLALVGSITLYALRARRAQLKFQTLAQRDGLTGIHNRQYFIEQAEATLAYNRKSLRDASLIAIDLDHFKQINDTHGHAAGDLALQAAVAVAHKHLRSVDIFGRLGGEEFGIVMPDCVPARAADIAEAIRADIANLHSSPQGPAFLLTASFGVASARTSGYDLTTLLAQADDALYQAKRRGRNRVVQHGPDTTQPGPPPGMPERRAV